MRRRSGQYLAPAYPYELVSAAKADRISWLAYERGQRNVYTAAAPDFRPVRLTRFLEDDGIDLTTLSISADGSVVVFVRGHEAEPHRVGGQRHEQPRRRGPGHLGRAHRRAGVAARRGHRAGRVAGRALRRLRERTGRSTACA